MKPVISVVVPAYNEEAVLETTFTRLDGVLKNIGDPYELIFVDDGSRDKTPQMLRDLAAQHPHVRVLHLARNFGQMIAITAGLEATRGDAVVIIDADLQDPPEVIPQMIEKWREGYDVVYGKRAKREGESFFKKATAFAYYRILRGLIRVPIPADTGDFRLVSRRAVDAVNAMPEHNRFLRGMFAWVGFRQTEVVFQREKRFAGQTKYSVTKMVKLAMDGILSFSSRPLDWITWLGLMLAVIGGVWLVVLLIMVIAGTRGLGMSALGGLSVLLGGMILGCMGIMGAYISRIYDEVKGRPLYIIAERNGYKTEQSDEES